MAATEIEVAPPQAESSQRTNGKPLELLSSCPRELIRSVHPEDRRRVYDARKAAASEGYDETYRVVRPDGTTRWVNDRAFPVMDENGTLYRIAGITEDVTDRKLAEERLKQFGTAYDMDKARADVERAQARLEAAAHAQKRQTGQ